VKLEVYNIRGQLVKTLTSSNMGSGAHEINWEGVNNTGQAVSSGVYFSRLTVCGKSLTNKMLLLK
jgi:flagellar hook assembly protein FlgD